jgi:hypothetical protein
LNATIAARDASIRDLLIAGAELAGTIATLTDTLGQRNAKIADMQIEIDGLNLTVEGLAAAIALWESRWPKNTCPKCGYSAEPAPFDRPLDHVPPAPPPPHKE